MFDTICDYSKLVVCSHFPRDISEIILEKVQHEEQQPLKQQMRNVLIELQKYEHTQYLNLLAQVYEKYFNNYESLYLLNPQDFMLKYYLSQLTFDIRSCSECAEFHDANDTFETLLLRNKAKEGYLMAMKYVLGST